MTSVDDRPEEIQQAMTLLELPPEASINEIRQAYRFLRDLYGGESIATLPISSEMNEAERKEILDKIEDAYGKLNRFFESERHKAAEHTDESFSNVDQFLSETDEITGSVLKTIRKMRGYGIEEVAVETRIPVQHLKRIEEELFKGLPPPVYTRGFVSGYAAFLQIDPRRAAKDFMNRLQRWRKQDPDSSPRRRFRLTFWRKRQ